MWSRLHVHPCFQHQALTRSSSYVSISHDSVARYNTTHFTQLLRTLESVARFAISSQQVFFLNKNKNKGSAFRITKN